jgi:hypothetical protein
MRLSGLLFAALLFLPAADAVAETRPPRVENGTAPRDGLEAVKLEEIWHRGHEDDDFIFGAIRNVQDGPDGNTYVLDTQLSQVFVFDPAGELLRTLSREGEGPGECRQPEDMVFLADGSLGIVQYINGRIIKIDLEGTPLGTLMPPGAEPDGGGMSSIRRARSRAGSFVINGAKVTPTPDGMLRTQYLVRCSPEGKSEVEYLSRSTASQLLRDGWVEKDNYFPSHERWDIDPSGRVLAATARNDYVITVFAPDGSVVFTFGRDAQPWKRTEEQKQEIRDSLVVLRDGARMQVEVDVEDHDPAILELTVMPDGEVWVLPSMGRRNQEPGVMHTYDVFDADGVFIRQVSVACPGDPEEDRLFFLDRHRAALVTGAVQARRNTFGGSRVQEDDVAVHDLKVYSF